MNQIIVSLILLLFSTSALACSIPMDGPEFDKHITVEKISKNRFKVLVSKDAEGLNYGAHATAEYYPVDSRYRFGEYSKTIFYQGKRDYSQDNSNYVYTFELHVIEGHIPFLKVHWFPEKNGLCGGYGKSNDLMLE